MTDALRANPLVRITLKLDDGPDRFVFRNHAENTAYEIPNPQAPELLAMAHDPVPRDELVSATVDRFDVAESRAASIVDRFVETGLLVDGDAAGSPPSDWDEDWAQAWTYHATIYDYPFHLEQESEQAYQRVRKRARRIDDLPSVYKRYDGTDTVTLVPEADLPSLGSVRDALAGRDSTRRRTADPDVDLETLSTLLFYSFGETGRIELPGVGEFLLKASPSAGARHPIEAYVAVPPLDRAPVDPGVYHYDVEGHALERIADRSSLETHSWLLPTDGPELSFAVGTSAYLPRDMWKYQDPRAYRVPFHDAGHVIETFRLVARQLGHEVGFEPATPTDEQAEALGVEPLTEPFLYTALVR